MEYDRAQADLGESVDIDLDSEKQEKPKQPKKRFIGRKAATGSVQDGSQPGKPLEDSDAIQGPF